LAGAAASLTALLVKGTINSQSLPSIVSLGDLSRLQNVLRRASSGLPVRIAGMGGSITAGAGASTPDKRWMTLVIKNINSVYGNVAMMLASAVQGATLAL
jgi:hypothetical protein